MKRSVHPDYKASLTNCLVGGIEFTDVGARRVRNKIPLKNLGFEVDLIQDPALIGQPVTAFADQQLHTTDLIVHNVAPYRVDAARRLVNHLSWLLQFASLSPVSVCGYEYPEGSGKSSKMATQGRVQYFRPTIDIQNGTIVQHFIHKTINNYKSLSRVRKIPVIIDYLVNAERLGQPVEVQLMMVFVALESLKDTYAKSKGIPYFQGYFRKAQNPSRRTPKYSFEELLKLMMHDVGMRRGFKLIIKMRNEIVHSGISRKTFNARVRMYDRCHDIIREYILRLLGYRGDYLSYSNPNMVLSL